MSSFLILRSCQLDPPCMDFIFAACCGSDSISAVYYAVRCGSESDLIAIKQNSTGLKFGKCKFTI